MLGPGTENRTGAPPGSAPAAPGLRRHRAAVEPRSRSHRLGAWLLHHAAEGVALLGRRGWPSPTGGSTTWSRPGRRWVCVSDPRWMSRAPSKRRILRLAAGLPFEEDGPRTLLLRRRRPPRPLVPGGPAPAVSPRSRPRRRCPAGRDGKRAAPREGEECRPPRPVPRHALAHELRNPLSPILASGGADPPETRTRPGPRRRPRPSWIRRGTRRGWWTSCWTPPASGRGRSRCGRQPVELRGPAAAGGGGDGSAPPPGAGPLPATAPAGAGVGRRRPDADHPVCGEPAGQRREVHARPAATTASRWNRAATRSASVSATPGSGSSPKCCTASWRSFPGGRSLDRSRGGLGLGLPLVKSLVELHGGGVAAASEGPGGGAEFGFWLPRCAPPRAAGLPRGASPRGAPAEGLAELASWWWRTTRRPGRVSASCWKARGSDVWGAACAAEALDTRAAPGSGSRPQRHRPARQPDGFAVSPHLLRPSCRTPG